MTERRRNGFALLLALGAIVVIGTLVAGASFSAMQQLRAAHADLMAARAAGAAELGVLEVMRAGEWDHAWDAMPAGSVALRTYAPVAGVTGSVRVIALGNTMFVVASETRSGAAAARVRAYIALDATSIPHLVTGRSWSMQ